MEYSASCRSLTNEKIELELDELICLGNIDIDGSSNMLISVKNHPGYFRLKPSSWDYIFQFFKDHRTFACLCPLSKDATKVLKEFSDLFSLQNEYVATTKLRNLISKVTQGGIEDPDYVTISGPASTMHRMINQSLATILKMYFCDSEVVEYNTLSLNDIIKIDDHTFTNVSEDLDELYLKAFPQNDKNINTMYLHQLIVQLTGKNMNESGMIQLFNVIQKMGYIPHVVIKKFGYLHVDHMPCIQLSFWPDIT